MTQWTRVKSLVIIYFLAVNKEAAMSESKPFEFISQVSNSRLIGCLNNHIINIEMRSLY